MQVCTEAGPNALSFHAASQPWRGPVLALALHVTAAALWFASPAAPPVGETAPVVELVFAPPPPPPPPQPPPTPQPAPPVPQPAVTPAPLAPPPAKPAPSRPAPVRPTAPAPAPAIEPASPPAALPAADSTGPADPAPPAAEPARRTAEAPPVAAEPDVKPTIADAPRPPYPRAARQRGMQGVVTLLVQVAEDGAPLTVSVKTSSGHAMLDDAALAAVRSWRFSPARRGGQAVAASVEVPVRFALNE